MVEKVSEASVKVEVNIDSSSNDDALFKWIDKKKKQKQDGENTVPVAMLPPDTLVRLLRASATGGGLQKTEKQTVKQDIPATFGQVVDSLQSEKRDSLRRQAVFTAAGQLAMVSTTKQNAAVAKGEMAKTVSSKDVAVVQNAKPMPAVNTHINTAAKTQQPVAVQQALVAPAANLVTVNISAPQAQIERRQQRSRDDTGEVRPTFQGTKPPEIVLPQPQQGENTAQSKNVPTTLQQLKTQASAVATAVKPGSESQTLEVDYQFQRWSGDHSVRISVPTEARREGNITLLPSDARAADVLQRNMGHLTGLTPDLLRPQQERDEQQQQRRQQQEQDEEQE